MCVVTCVIVCLIWLCNVVFLSIYVDVVDRALCGQRKSHRTRTKQWNPSVMFSSITHNCIVAIVCSQHTRLVSSNRLCCYRSSHTFPITDLFATYHTHLVHLNHFCSHVSTQIVHLSEPHAVYCTHLESCWPFLLCCLITNSSSE